MTLQGFHEQLGNHEVGHQRSRRVDGLPSDQVVVLDILGSVVWQVNDQIEGLVLNQFCCWREVIILVARLRPADSANRQVVLSQVLRGGVSGKQVEAHVGEALGGWQEVRIEVLLNANQNVRLGAWQTEACGLDGFEEGGMDGFSVAGHLTSGSHLAA